MNWLIAVVSTTLALQIGTSNAAAQPCIDYPQGSIAIPTSAAVSSPAEPTVIATPNGYRMWFTANTPTNPGRRHIFTAHSSNGVTWQHDGIALAPGPGWDDINLYNCSVLLHNGQYRMWYTGYSGPYNKIGYATSTNGVAWTKHSSNPVLVGGSGWDQNLRVATVIYDELSQRYKMWYTGTNGWFSQLRVGYATSSDGISWTKHPANPIMTYGNSVEWIRNHVRVWRVGSGYEMYVSSSYNDIRLATSSDGLNWIISACPPVLASGSWEGGRVSDACVIDDSSIRRVWYTGGAFAAASQIGAASTVSQVISQPTYPQLPPPPPGASKLVFITHGWNTQDDHWQFEWLPLHVEIQAWINAHAQDPSEWQVILYDWRQASRTPDPISALDRAKEHGECQGSLLVQAVDTLSASEVHFIAHSAGAALIEAASAKIKQELGSNAPRMQCTFLDAFVGINPWPSYGKSADWSDHYFATDTTGWVTARRLAHAHNVDVTRLDPCAYDADGRGYWLSAHGWPREFYRWTLALQSQEPNAECAEEMPPHSCDDGYGWSRSLAAMGGSWNPQLLDQLYPLGNSAEELVCGARAVGHRQEPEFTHRLDPVIDPLDVQNVVVSTSDGGVTVLPIGFDLEAEPGASYGPEGNTAWAYFSVALPQTINFVRYQADFNSPGDAEGLLSIYVGDKWLSTDERFDLPGVEEFFFELPEEIGPGTVTLGFRLDAFGTGVSQASVSNIETGYGGYLPGVFTLVGPADAVNAETLTPTLEWEQSFEARQYIVRIATDPLLSDVILTQVVAGATTFAVPDGLLDGQHIYYWDVTSSNVLGEEIAEPGVWSFTTPLLGDVNDDGMTNASDFVILAGFYGLSVEPGTNGDLNGDGLIDAADFTILAGSFGFVAPGS